MFSYHPPARRRCSGTQKSQRPLWGAADSCEESQNGACQAAERPLRPSLHPRPVLCRSISFSQRRRLSPKWVGALRSREVVFSTYVPFGVGAAFQGDTYLKAVSPRPH